MSYARTNLPKVTRRQVIAGVSATFAQTLLSRNALSLPGDFEGNPFTLGIASGDPGPNSTVLWTRLAPRPLDVYGGLTSPQIAVEWIIASDEKMRQVVRSGESVARKDSAYSVHVPVEGLLPQRHYWYQFRTKGYLSSVGRTKTLPGTRDQVDRFKLAIAGCQRIDDGYYAAWSDIAKADVDLVFHYGDYIYEHHITAAAISARLGQDLPEQGPTRLGSLQDFRRRYALYKLDRDLTTVHATHPFAVTFDDHEVRNNWSGTDGRFSALSKVALQAYFENMPMHPRRLVDGKLRMYRALAIGNLLRFAIMDTRQYRSPQACDMHGKRVHCEDRMDPKRTILGEEQEHWLNGILTANAQTWTVLGNQVMMMQEKFDHSQQADPDEPEVESSDIVGTDKWDGYAAARTRLLQTCIERKTAGFVVVSGDRHVSMAGNLKLDFEEQRSPVAGVELVATSISSGRNGRAGGGKIQRLNPHIGFVDRRRGSLICEFRHQSLDAEFRATDAVDKPGAPVRPIKTIRIDPKSVSL